MRIGERPRVLPRVLSHARSSRRLRVGSGADQTSPWHPTGKDRLTSHHKGQRVCQGARKTSTGYTGKTGLRRAPVANGSNPSVHGTHSRQHLQTAQICHCVVKRVGPSSRRWDSGHTRVEEAQRGLALGPGHLHQLEDIGLRGLCKLLQPLLGLWRPVGLKERWALVGMARTGADSGL